MTRQQFDLILDAMGERPEAGVYFGCSEVANGVISVGLLADGLVTVRGKASTFIALESIVAADMRARTRGRP
jgi:hypothetical protein